MRLASCAAIAAVALVAFAALPAGRVAADDDPRKEVEAIVLEWLGDLLGGRTDEALAATGRPFVAGERRPKDGGRVVAQVIEDEKVLAEMFGDAKSDHKVKTFTKVDASAPFPKEEAAKVPELARVLPEGGHRVIIADASGTNPDRLEIFVSPAGKIVAALEEEN